MGSSSSDATWAREWWRNGEWDPHVRNVCVSKVVAKNCSIKCWNFIGSFFAFRVFWMSFWSCFRRVCSWAVWGPLRTCLVAVIVFRSLSWLQSLLIWGCDYSKTNRQSSTCTFWATMGKFIILFKILNIKIKNKKIQFNKFN